MSIIASTAKNLAGAVARGYRNAVAPYDEPGAAVKVAPFAPGTVSAGAIAAKTIASLFAGRREAANSRYLREQQALKMQHDTLALTDLQQRVQVGKPTTYTDKSGVTRTMTGSQAAQHASADNKSATPEVRTPLAPEIANKLAKIGAPVAGYDPEKGDAPDKAVGRAMEQARIIAEERRHADLQNRIAAHEGHAKKYAAAQRALANIDAEEKADVAERETQLARDADTNLMRMKSHDPAEQKKGAAALGIDLGNDGKSVDDKQAAEAVKTFIERGKARWSVVQRMKNAQRRKQFENVTAGDAGIEPEAGPDPLDALIESWAKEAQ